MADPSLWSGLKDDVLTILKDAAKDLVDVEKPEVKALLAEVAEEGAKQSYLLINGNDAEKAQAPSNLRSLKAHVIIDVADGVIVSSKELKAAFVKIIETAGLFLLQNAPKLIAAAI
jgi:hypothetical protein